CEVIREMRASGVDLVVLSLHWGFEFEAYPCAKIMALGRELARAGADIIFGHHPHVQQPAEVLFFNGYESGLGAPPPEAVLTAPDGRARKSLILYSMGNFSTAMFTPLIRLGLVQGVEIWRDAEGGGVDWSFAESLWCANFAKHPVTGKRALVTIPELEALVPQLRGQRAKSVHAMLGAARSAQARTGL
ncbi:MAG: CapA family protein, partial [Roseimicrobium sp.]